MAELLPLLDFELGRVSGARQRPVLRDRRSGLRPRVGIVLGSGLGVVADAVEDPDGGGLRGAARLPRARRRGPRRPRGGGPLGGVPAAVLQGRAHLYEGVDPDALRTPVRTLRAAGAEILLLTNAAGSLRPEVGPGRLMAITDHINLTRAERADRAQRRPSSARAS